MELGAEGFDSFPPHYDEIFPQLPTAGPPPKPIADNIPSFKPVTVTEIIEIPVEERRFQSAESATADQLKVCSAIGRQFGVQIEFVNNKSKSLSVVVTGMPANVSKAKVMIVQDLQQQAQRTVKVPTEYHRFLIGYKGQKKQELEAATLTKIFIPPSGRKSNEVIITGSPNKLDAAEKEILRLVEFHAQQAVERFNIPKVYHQFICGPYNRTITELRERTNTKINIPPSHIQADDITVSGKKADVAKATAEIKKIFQERSQRCTTIPAIIQREKHRLVIGYRGSGLSEILDQTGVVVEPPSDPDSEEFTLRGYPEDLGKASTMVFQRASRSATEEVTAPQRLHKLLIGKKGAAVAMIREGYEAVRIDFPSNGDKITIEGPPEEVAIIVDRLNARIAELNASHHLEVITVDPKHHSKLFGNSQESITQFLRFGRMNVRFPTGAECGKVVNESQICIEGDKAAVDMVKDEIKRLTQKWENEKTKDVIVEPRIQRLLRSGNPPPIRQVEDEFPDVEIRWPDYQAGGNRRQRGAPPPQTNKSATDFIVQICGIRDQVDTAYDRFNKLIRHVTEENHEQEIRLFKDCMQHILGAPIVNLLKETKTRIRYNTPSEDGSRVAFIIGRQEDVNGAIDRLEKLQRSLANLKEMTITLPSLMLTKQAGDANTPGARLRSIREQCEGVQLRTNPAKPRELTISGPHEAVDKAKALVDSMSAKMAEKCADTVVFADPKFHGQLIGRGGANLKRLRENHDVEILFPDRLESDPKRASEIHIIGEKEAVAKAVKDLEQSIKTLEDETDATIQLDAALVKDLISYRNAFSYPEFERVKVLWPRNPNSPPTRRGNDQQLQQQQTNGDASDAQVRIFGPKGCVEAAEQCVKKMIDDIKAQKVVRHPVAEQSHCQALNRSRSSISDIQRNHNVLISLQLNRDGFVDEESDQTIYGHIVLTGRQENIDNVLANEILPLLPVSEEVDFPQEFHGKLFATEQPQAAPGNNKKGKDQQQPPRRGNNRQQPQNRGQRGPTRGNNAQHEPEEVEPPQTKLAALQSKFNVSIHVPPRNQRGTNQITVRGPPDAVDACKVEIAKLLATLQDEKADWEARNYEEKIDIEERFLNRIVNSEKDRIFKAHGVAIFTRGGAAQQAPAQAPVTNGNTDEKTEESEDPTNTPSTSEPSPGKFDHLAGYKLLRTTIVSLVMQGYRDKVALARAELEELMEKFNSFTCEELHIPSDTHARLIGMRRFNIRRIEETYKVDVEFPPRGAVGKSADIVLVMGAPKDVDDACDELITKANDMVERSPMHEERSQEKKKAPAPQQPPSQSDFVVVGAPWEKE